MDDGHQKRWVWEAVLHATYFVPHGTLQFLLATPVAMIPALRRSMVSGAAIDLAISAGTAANAIGKVVNGVTVDQIGASLFAKSALGLGVGALILFGLARMKGLLFLSFILLQFAASGGWLIGCRVIHDWFPKLRWGACFAILSAASRVASMLCKLGLGAALAHFSWRQICLAAASIGGIMLLLSTHLFWVSTRWQRTVSATRDDEGCEGPLVVDDLETTQQHRHLVGYEPPLSLEPNDDATTITDQHRRDSGAASDTSAKACAEVGFKIVRLLSNRGLVLYSIVEAGATCIAQFDSMVPILLGDLTPLSDAQISMSATVFPASLLVSVATGPWLLSRLEKRRRNDNEYQRRGWLAMVLSNNPGLLLELVLLGISLVSALALSSLAAVPKRRPPFLVLLCVCGLSYGIGITYYITPNVYALDFGGKDCATASAILDTVGLVTSSLWALVAAAVKGSMGKFRAWHVTMLLLATIVLATAVFSIAAALVVDLDRKRGMKKESPPDLGVSDAESLATMDGGPGSPTAALISATTTPLHHDASSASCSSSRRPSESSDAPSRQR